ncbi:hypothetical protein BJF83_01725 [Nocardiopsis sp. CNR-923]|uniref:DUF4129 domain-containing protein n=1 Tax=Nocardiopsis sp. CNR-923 TaxID=1904965 RepID=UPI000967F513|nr:DUF4129 domain-containing protein [Nocardiopsis sp. CNR-923]OLT28242.1 hypothetical protein BJF83_01725 [Nocardiopsis sp. CNR-923]
MTATGVAEVTREEGRRRAVEELSDPLYGERTPSLLDRIREWVFDLLAGLIEAGSGVVGGWAVLGPLLAVLAVLLVWLVVYLRPSSGRRRGAAVHAEAPLSVADHRAAAERHEAAEEYAAAVTERLRAISVALEERAVLTPRLGRTATELAQEASVVLPGEAGGLSEGARIFNDVAYGDRPATAESARILRELDLRLESARPVAAQEEAR